MEDILNRKKGIHAKSQMLFEDSRHNHRGPFPADSLL